MKYLFSEAGRQILESLTFTETLYAFDFDGTLSPIAKAPEKAILPRETEDFLAELSSLATVAIISGRSRDNLKGFLNFKPHYLIGNHGLEGLASHQQSSRNASSICSDWKIQLAERWGGLNSDPGIFVEDKGFSIALHYRKSRNKKDARHELFQRIESLSPPPRIILGKSVMNLIPAGAPHKGVALLELMISSQTRTALYLGDDDTDEDVFSLPDSGIISVRVGHKRQSHAQFFLKRQSEVKTLLRHLVTRLQKSKGSLKI